jgi:peptidoglycan hydrolase-like protein with peptidoglycan-binding domain
MLLACLAGFGATAASASLPAVGACQADAELTLFDKGPSVICLQFALGMLHISNAPITGVFDKATLDAVMWFQATHPPLRADGRAGARTLAAMGIWSGKTSSSVVGAQCRADATIQPGQRSMSVRCMQDTLRELGLFQGVSSGIDDPATVDALKRYQRATPPLQVDGWAGPRTLAAMGIWSGNATGKLRGGVAPPGPWPAPPQDEPFWNSTKDGVPYYGYRTPCSRGDANMIAYQFAKDGADVATQQWAVYIASREGGCRYDAVNVNMATLDDSHCSFQLNALAGMFDPGSSLGRLGWTVDTVKLSMENCANAASDLWVYCGRGPWTPPYSCRPPWGDPVAAVPADGG